MTAFWRAICFCLLACALAGGGLAKESTKKETPPTNGKIYAPVPIVYDLAPGQDADLAALAKQLRTAAEAHDLGPIEAALSPDFVMVACAADPLQACGAHAKIVGARKGKPIDRMRLGFCCDGKPAPDMPQASQNETLFAMVGSALAAPTLGANPDDAAEICSPALPRFDRAAAAKAAKAAGVEPENLRVATAAMDLRPRPDAAAAVSAKLAIGDIAPIVTDLTANTPGGWTAVGLPDGSIGFSNSLGLEELTPAALCFSKRNGAWRLVAAVTRQG